MSPRFAAAGGDEPEELGGAAAGGSGTIDSAANWQVEATSIGAIEWH
jgi:hypothetical protein